MPSDAPKRPDYHVAAMNNAGRNTRCGAAWKNEDGSIYIKLDLFIGLVQEGDLQIRLFPAKERPPASPGSPPLPEDDIPF